MPHYKFHQIIKYQTFNIIKKVVVFIFTYRLELQCDVEKTLHLPRPAPTIVSRRAYSAGACTVGGSTAVRPPTARTSSGRLCGLRTRVGVASSSLSSSSMTQSSHRCFGVWPPKPSLVQWRFLVPIRPAPPLLGMALWPSVSFR